MQADATSEEYQKRRPHLCGQLCWAKASGRGQRKTLQTMLEEVMTNQLRSAERLRTWSRMRRLAPSSTVQAQNHLYTFCLDFCAARSTAASASRHSDDHDGSLTRDLVDPYGMSLNLPDGTGEGNHGSALEPPPCADEAGGSERFKADDASWQPIEPKPLSAVKEKHPSPKVGRSEMRPGDFGWKDIGSGVFAKTFKSSKRFVTTSKG